MILINQNWWTVWFCCLSNPQHSCMNHSKISPWRESFTTCQVLHRTRDTRDSQISDIGDRLEHITLKASQPAGCSGYINKLPPANVEKCPIPFSINEILRCDVKVSWLRIFCILRGVFFAKVKVWSIIKCPESITFFHSEQRPSPWSLGSKFWPATSVQQHAKM